MYGKNDMRECFDKIDLKIILDKQNQLSQEIECSYIWVLNTCVFLVPDYKFDLIK